MGEQREHNDHDHGHDHDHDHDHDHGEDVAALDQKVDIEEVGPWKKKLKIEVSADSVKGEYEESLKEFARSAVVSGFRKGRVPRARLLKQFGKPLAEEVKAKLVGRAAEEAMKANDLEAISTPDVNIDDLTLESDAAFAFEITVEVKPTFEMPNYKGLKLNRKAFEIDDERVDNYINALRRNDADYVPVEEGGAKPGDRLTVDARLEIEGEEKWKTENDTAHLLDDAMLGLSIPAKREDVEGIAPGEERQIEVTVPNSFKEEELRGQTGTMFLKANEIKRPQLPDLDDEAAQKLGAENAEDLKTRVKERLEMQGKSDQEEDMRTQVVDQLIDGATFDLPEGMLERETQAREMRQMMRMAQMGVRPDDMEEQQRQEMREGAKTSSDRNLRASLILAKIAEAESVEVADEELEEEIFRLAASYGKTPVAIRSQLEREGRIEPLREGVATSKVVNLIIEQADITDAAEESAVSDGEAS